MASDFEKLLSNLNLIKEEVEKPTKFDKDEHDTKSRLEITKLFLNWYFWLIAGSFVFCLFYNLLVASMNAWWLHNKNIIPYIEVSNTVAIVTTTLSSGLGFVIGYYFKNKGEH